MTSPDLGIIESFWVYVVRPALRGREEDWRAECVRTVSEVMDASPQWREWFAHQLELLDLEYDRGWWLRMEEITSARFRIRAAPLNVGRRHSR